MLNDVKHIGSLTHPVVEPEILHLRAQDDTLSG
jgi:hypothetical protein